MPNKLEIDRKFAYLETIILHQSQRIDELSFEISELKRLLSGRQYIKRSMSFEGPLNSKSK